jgi:hypothetical protein
MMMRTMQIFPLDDLLQRTGHMKSNRVVCTTSSHLSKSWETLVLALEVVFSSHHQNSQTIVEKPNAVRVIHDGPTPGMRAYHWELVMQLISLHFAKHLRHDHLVLTSDCTSAIACTNQSLSTRNNKLANARGELFAAGTHAFADPLNASKFIYTRGHPERTESRRLNPTFRDEAM